MASNNDFQRQRCTKCGALGTAELWLSYGFAAGPLAETPRAMQPLTVYVESEFVAAPLFH